MTLRPIAFNSTTKVYTMIHDEGQHQVEIPISELNYAPTQNGPTHNVIYFNCPLGDGGSSHPVSGGAAAFEVQQMFVTKITEEGCICGNVEAGNANLADAHAHLNCVRLDGDERWQV